MSHLERPILDALADRAGILPSYIGVDGLEHHTSERTRRSLLTAMGIDVSTQAAAARSLAESLDAARDETLPPVRVVDQRATRKLGVIRRRTPHSSDEVVAWEVEVTEEGGERHRVTSYPRAAGRGISVRFPRPLPLGYHTLRLTARMGDGRRLEGIQSLIVTPERCCMAALADGQRRFYGLLAQLYTLRSKANWGIGDFGDLKKLIEWGGDIGAAFVGVNPLHALTNRGDDISPYSPVSRLYRNVAYIDVMSVPETRRAPAAIGLIESPAFQRELTALRKGSHVDYERVMDLKCPVLEILHREFVARHRDRPTSRGRAYRRYLAAEGEALADFATFSTLQRHFSSKGAHRRDWRAWPRDYRDPRSETVRHFARRHAEEINLHRYLQFELDRQLGAACARARSTGLVIGLYQDLAIGSSPSGSDTWAFPGTFLEGVTLGAPPDPFHCRGQDWRLPPLDPRRLTADGYRYWIRLVRGAFAHSGALRIDHVMGLFRQFWVPADRPATDGAYVRFPAGDLLGILALESVRAGALVIGEDLGTVPRGLPKELARWGVLCTRVLYFARDKNGSFWPSRAYPQRALVSANTHDMAPLAGYWRGYDLDLRRQSGQLRSARALSAARSDRARERRLLVRRLAADGALPNGREPRAGAELSSAIHGFLCRTPAALVGISLDDLTGEVEPVNMPGVGAEKFQSWSRRLRLPIDELPTDPEVNQALQGIRKSRRARGRPVGATKHGSQRARGLTSKRRRERAPHRNPRSRP